MAPQHDLCGEPEREDRPASKVADAQHAAAPPGAMDIRRCKETYFHTSLIKDSITVQKHHPVNDDEVHEENPHLEDYLIPHHSAHVGPEEAAAALEASRARLLTLKIEPSFRHAGQLEQAKAKRSVHFGEVLVRDYGMILGDHPCCSYGPPVTIDWDYLEYEPLDVDEYEFHRPARRGMNQMGLNYYQRKKILSEAGYTESDLKERTKELNRVKLCRTITRQIVSNYPLLMKAEAAVESLVRKLKRLVKDDHWKQQKSMFVK